jgi:hypothetical protein
MAGIKKVISLRNNPDPFPPGNIRAKLFDFIARQYHRFRKFAGRFKFYFGKNLSAQSVNPTCK